MELVSADLSLRQQYLLTYAEYLQSDPGLWRITIDYMYSCGQVGQGMADQVLLRVPLRLQSVDPASEEAARIRSGQLTGVLLGINEACREYQREEVRREVCRVCICSFPMKYPLNDVGDVSDSSADVRAREEVRPCGFVLHVCRGLAGPRTHRGPCAR